MEYFRPIAMTDAARPADAFPLAGGWCWFSHAEVLTRGGGGRVVRAGDLPAEVLERLTAGRAPLAGLSLDRPRLMAVLNVTPDSFSDGGRFLDPAAAVAQARAMAAADILDIGGESTRPGAAEVAAADEVARVVPVIAALRSGGVTTPVSVDTRKSEVARAALAAGADLVNDVAALTYDAGLGPLVAEAGVPLVLMHAQGSPATMQTDPRYDDVLLDVYDWLAERVDFAVAAGISRDRIVVDPGIGFGKTVGHNLALIRGLSLFHGLGCAVLLGASRKRFIGTLADEPQADRRGPGTIAATLAGLAQGVQIHRVHDIPETRQAVALWRALNAGDFR
jgi:dihydropteroate synthase